jgi:hypothetical protein
MRRQPNSRAATARCLSRSSLDKAGFLHAIRLSAHQFSNRAIPQAFAPENIPAIGGEPNVRRSSGWQTAPYF